jgi:hypothetical protein
MKRFLSFLLMVVFMHVQVPTAFAKHGGPDFGGAGAAITGTYAGVIEPVIDPATSNSLVDLDSNALGLFNLQIPFTGMATGVCAIFNKGEIFTGKMTGVGDPATGEVKMLMEAQAIRVISIQVSAGAGAALSGNLNVVAVGRLEAQVEQTTDFLTPQRIEGTAILSSFDDTNRNADGTPILSGLIQFTVDGFKQSETPTESEDIDLGVDINR